MSSRMNIGINKRQPSELINERMLLDIYNFKRPNFGLRDTIVTQFLYDELLSRIKCLDSNNYQDFTVTWSVDTTCYGDCVSIILNQKTGTSNYTQLLGRVSQLKCEPWIDGSEFITSYIVDSSIIVRKFYHAKHDYVLDTNIVQDIKFDTVHFCRDYLN